MSNNFSNPSISESVGLGGRNKPSDTFIIQRLLNECKTPFEDRGNLVPDGRAGRKTYDAIKAFQRTVAKINKPDSRVDAGKGTFNKLISERDPKFVELNMRIAAQNTMSTILDDSFIDLYKNEFKDHVLNEKSINGLKFLISKLNDDEKITDIRWAAYMLATVKRECGSNYQPVEEVGKGNYFSSKLNVQVEKEYSKPIEVQDPSTNKTRENTYYGRGFVQITWAKNYKKMGKAIGLSDKLYIQPELALDPDIAYKIMTIGMRDGIFTGLALKQFITGSYTDYVGARRIINGKDKKDLIAGYAEKFELLLKLSEANYLTFMRSNFNIFDWSIKQQSCEAPAFSKVLMKY